MVQGVLKRKEVISYFNSFEFDINQVQELKNKQIYKTEFITEYEKQFDVLYIEYFLNIYRVELKDQTPYESLVRTRNLRKLLKNVLKLSSQIYIRS